MDPDCQKIILVVRPLSALMQSQAAGLVKRGVPAVALTSATKNPEKTLKVCALSSIQ
jgi:superfamily II DNA helicase RecQ